MGDAGQRFDEDALQMLRAVRFSGQLGFTIEDATLQAMKQRIQNLQKISAERIRVEMTKLLISPNPGSGYLIALSVYHNSDGAMLLPRINGFAEQPFYFQWFGDRYHRWSCLCNIDDVVCSTCIV